MERSGSPPGRLGLEAEIVTVPAGPSPWGLVSAARLIAVLRGRLAVEGPTGRCADGGGILMLPGGRRQRLIVGVGGVRLALLRIRSRALAPNQEVDRLAGEALRRLLGHVRVHGPRLPLAAGPARTAAAWLVDMADQAAAGGCWHGLALKARFLDLLRLLVEVLPQSEAAPAAPLPLRDLKDLLAHLDEHPERPLTVAQAAAAVGLGRSRFHQVFRETTGTTFATYLTRLRLGRAAEALRREPRPVLDIALAHGFNSLSRFYQAFVREMGVPPARWRRGG